MEIIDKKIIGSDNTTKIIQFILKAPLIAKRVKAGQFIVVVVVEEGERIPLTVVEKDIKEGTITLIIQEAGLSTKLLSRLNAGNSIYALVGPLGQATPIKKYGRVILIGGGVGIAEIYPVAKALKKAGNHITTLIGAKTKNLLILEDKLKKISDELYVTTDDGSYGKKGFTTEALKELLTKYEIPARKYKLVYAVGPLAMMKKIASLTEEAGIKTLVSLNALMVDATGMCGCCRVTVKGEVKFSCFDGPEFDAHLVNWEELEQRNRVYEEKEKQICKLYQL